MSLHCSRPFIRDVLGRARNVLHLGALSVTYLAMIRCVVFVSCTRVSFLAIASSGLSVIYLLVE